MSNLMLTGQGTPYLHNGILPTESDSDFDFGDGKLGIITRNDIGFLAWDPSAVYVDNLCLGSRMKTPILPIWVTYIKGKWGVLFNPNKDLMKSYSAENRFQMFYYSSTVTKAKDETILTIDTRGAKPRSEVVEDPEEPEEDKHIEPLEKAIQTKWEGAKVFWKDIKPYL